MKRGGLVAAAAAALLLPLSALAGAPFWRADGGTPQRTSNAALNVDITQYQGAQWTATYSSNVEDTTSEVEESLLNSPLVTSTNMVVVGSDDCTVALLKSPDSLNPGDTWGTPGAAIGGYHKWKAPTENAAVGAPDECVLQGFALDNTNGLYVLDGRNEILYKLLYNIQEGFGPNPVVWNITFFPAPLDFNDDVSMVFVPGSDPLNDPGLLWVPLAASLLGNSGIAAVVNPVTGSYSFVPANGGCRPADFGSAAVTVDTVALLGDADCGMVVMSATAGVAPSTSYKTYPDWGRMLFDYGEHSHPIYDASTGNLYIFDWAETMLSNQKVCCINMNNYAECAGWSSSGCTRIPELSSEQWDEGMAYYRWEWIAGAIYGNYIYIATSGTTLDKVIIQNGRADLISALFVYDITSGKLVATHRFNGDMFNTAPLVVQGTTGDVRVYVVTTLGVLYCYGPDKSVNNGPLWTNQAVAPIPDEDLPSTTYSYLSLTPGGTIMVTASAGGADWADEKVYYAIVNGVFPPSPPASPPSGLSPGAAAGVAITVLGVLGAAFGVAYVKMPVFAVAVNGVASTVQSKVLTLTGGYSSLLKTPGVPSASAINESKGLLSGSGGYGSTAGATGSEASSASFTGASGTYL